MEVRTCTAFDLMSMPLQPSQHYVRENMTAEYVTSLLAGGQSFAATVDGEPVACIGLIEHWPGRRYVWAFMATTMHKYSFLLTHNIGRWLRYHGQGRIETAIDCANARDIRFAEALGFTCEGLMRQWTPDKRDCFLYSRVR